MTKVSAIERLTIKQLGAIALFGLLLTLSDTPRPIQQAGRAVAFLASGASIAILLQGDRESAGVARANQQSARNLADLPLADLPLTDLQREQQIIKDLYETVLIETALQTQLNQVQSRSQDEAAQAKSRISELEAALNHKTQLATQMLTELEAEATSTFEQFNQKIAAQDNQINHLQRQIASLRAENAAIAAQQTHAIFSAAHSDRSANSHLLKQLARN